MSRDAKTLIEKVVKGADPAEVVMEGRVRWNPSSKWASKGGGDDESWAFIAKLLKTSPAKLSFADWDDFVGEEGSVVRDSMKVTKKGEFPSGKLAGLEWSLGQFENRMVVVVDDGMGDISYVTAKTFDI